MIKLFLQSGTGGFYLAKAEMQWLNSRRSRFRFRQVSRAVNARFGPHPAQATHEYSPRLDALPERQPLGHGTTAQNRRDQLCRTRYTCEVGFTVPQKCSTDRSPRLLRDILASGVVALLVYIGFFKGAPFMTWAPVDLTVAAFGVVAVCIVCCLMGTSRNRRTLNFHSVIFRCLCLPAALYPVWSENAWDNDCACLFP